MCHFFSAQGTRHRYNFSLRLTYNFTDQPLLCLCAVLNFLVSSTVYFTHQYPINQLTSSLGSGC